MGLLSGSMTVIRYLVEGKVGEPVLETIAAGLERNAIGDIDTGTTEAAAGWTSLADPYEPRFSDHSFAVGTYLVFSLRIDKKSVPAKLVRKHYAREVRRRLRQPGVTFLSREERRQIREEVEEGLLKRTPAVPAVHDVLWRYEEGTLWFFAANKGATAALEALFRQSFNLGLIRLFPFTMADLTMGLPPASRDQLAALKPTRFIGR